MATLVEAMQDYQLDPKTLRSSEALLNTPAMTNLYDIAGVALYRNPAGTLPYPTSVRCLLTAYLIRSHMRLS